MMNIALNFDTILYCIIGLRGRRVGKADNARSSERHSTSTVQKHYFFCLVIHIDMISYLSSVVSKRM